MATFRTITPQSIDAATTLGVTTLRVADAGRSLVFYRDLLGFQVLEQTESTILLGSPNQVVLRLDVEAGLKRHPSHTLACITPQFSCQPASIWPMCCSVC